MSKQTELSGWDSLRYLLNNAMLILALRFIIFDNWMQTLIMIGCLFMVIDNHDIMHHPNEG